MLIDLEDSINLVNRLITLRVPDLSQGGHMQLRERTLNVRIPKGIRPGQQLRLAGQGRSDLGSGESGDLFSEVEICKHPPPADSGSARALDKQLEEQLAFNPRANMGVT